MSEKLLRSLIHKSSGESSLKKIVEISLDTISTLYPETKSEIILLGSTGEELARYKSSDSGKVRKDKVEFKSDSTLIRLFKQGKAIEIEDLEKNDLIAELKKETGRRYASCFVQPIGKGPDTFGCILIFCERKGRVRRTAGKALSPVADIILMAFERDMAGKRERSFLSLIDVIGEIGKRVDERDHERLFNTTASLIRKLFGFAIAGIYLIREDKERLQLKGLSCKWEKTKKSYLEESIRLERALYKETIHSGFKIFKNRNQALSGKDFAFEAILPVKLSKETLGMLHVASFQPRLFTESDLRTIEILSDQLAIAIDKSRLFAELRESNKFTDEVLYILTGGLVLTDRHGKIKRMNLKATEILRVGEEEAVGRKMTDLFRGSEKMFHFDPDQIHKETEIELSDGTVIPVGFSNSFFVDSHGKFEAIIISFQDLSELKELYKRIRLKERLATIGEVAAGVAHEIRNPLFGITSSAHLIERELGHHESIGNIVKAMLSETDRLNELIENLLDYGKPSSLDRKKLDIGVLLEESLNFHKENLKKNKIEVEKKYPLGELIAKVDPDKLKQVFTNLLLNAIDFAPEGRIGIRGRIKEENGKAVIIEIQDTGAGIPEENKEKVFNLFFTTKKSGSGMGLPICRKIVEDHGGEISVESEPRRGTKFTVKLPF